MPVSSVKTIFLSMLSGNPSNAFLNGFYKMFI